MLIDDDLIFNVKNIDEKSGETFEQLPLINSRSVHNVLNNMKQISTFQNCNCKTRN